ALKQWMFIVYNAALPAAIIIGSLYNQRGNISNQTFLQSAISWIAFITFNSALSSNLEVIALREQGYLKQYRTLLKSPYIFVFSKQLVALTFEFLSLIIIVLASFLILNIDPRNLIIFFLIAFLGFWPLSQLFQIFLDFPISHKSLSTITMIGTAVSLLLAVSLEKYSTLFSAYATGISPIGFVSLIFSYIYRGTNIYLLLYLIYAALYILIGYVGFKKMIVVPTKKD
ncbi:MAG: hypothetical protein ABF643_08320, partial [Oenococcus oeni]